MERLPTYEALIRPLVNNFIEKKSSLIVTTASADGAEWLMGKPTIEDMYYAKSEKKSLGQMIKAESDGVLWKGCDDILSEMTMEEELVISVVGVDQSGTYDLFKPKSAGVFSARAIPGAQDPFAVTMPGLSRRSAKTTRSARIIISQAIVRAMNEQGKLAQHVLIGMRIQPVMGTLTERQYKTTTQAIAVSPPRPGEGHMLETTAEIPEFRALLVADEYGPALPLEEVASEAGRISDIVEGRTPASSGVFGSTLPLLLRFSLSAPACYKVMVVTTTENPALKKTLKTVQQKQNLSRLQNSLLALAKSMAKLPRLMSSPNQVQSNSFSSVRSPSGRPRSRLRQGTSTRAASGSRMDMRANTPTTRRDSMSSAVPGGAESYSELKRKVDALQAELTASQVSVFELRQELNRRKTSMIDPVELQKIREKLSEQEEQILAMDAMAQHVPRRETVLKSCSRVLGSLRRACVDLDLTLLAPALARRIERLNAIGEDTLARCTCDELVKVLENASMGFVAVIKMIVSDLRETRDGAE